MFQKLVRTNDDAVLTVVRLVLGVVFFMHGAQKVLGWFGGGGFSATLGAFTHGLGIPAPFALLAFAAEFLGGLGLLVGLLARVAAFGIACNMVVAILMFHRHNGFFMNWMGNQKGEGFEYHLLALALLVVIMVKGAGPFSLDRVLSRGPNHLDAAPARA